MSEIHKIQCLLFLVDDNSKFSGDAKRKDYVKKLRSSSSLPPARGYALFPPDVVEDPSPASEILKENDIQVILQDQEYPALYSALRNNRVEVMQIFFEGEDHDELKIVSKKGEPCLKVLIRFSSKRKETIKSNLSRRVVLGTVEEASEVFWWPAVEENNFEVLCSLLRHRADIRYKHKWGGTLLHYAVKLDDRPFIKLLLKNGANINAQRQDSATPLYIAIRDGHEETSMMLLRKGANTHFRMRTGKTCLHVAAEKGHLEMVQKLLQCGVFVNSTWSVYESFPGGNTPLHSAITSLSKRHWPFPEYSSLSVDKLVGIVKLLLHHGADVNAYDYWEESILQSAVRAGIPEIVRAILRYQPELNNVNHSDAFYSAVRGIKAEAKEIGDMLIGYGFVPSAKMILDYDFLHGIVRQNRYQMLRNTLSQGTNVHHSYAEDTDHLPKGITLLHTAARYADENTINLLVEFGADVNVKCARGKTPIFYAAEFGNVQGVNTLLRLGALVDATTHNDRTALHIASSKGFHEIVELLLQNGADIQHQSERCWTPILYGTEAGNLTVIKILLKHGALINCEKPFETVLHLAVDKGFSEIIEFFLLHGADVNTPCTYNRHTPLFIAARKGFLQAIDILLTFGADINFKSRIEKTALHYAAQNSQEVFQYLLEFYLKDLTLISKTNICKLFDISRVNNYFYTHNRTTFEKSAVVLAQHIIKKQAAGFPVDGKDLSVPWYCTDLTKGEFENACAEEVSLLKYSTFRNSGATFFDVITNDVNRNVCFVRNQAIVKTLESETYKKKFPIYASVIDLQFSRGCRRMELLQLGFKIFNALFRGFFTLPRELKERIMSFLSNKDLMILKEACKPTDS